jgi:hypothetical protein
LGLLEELSQAGATIVVVTHDRDSALAAPAPARLRIADLARLAANGLATRKLRAALSALGIAIGVAAIVAVLGLSSSSAAGLNAEIAALGATKGHIRIQFLSEAVVLSLFGGAARVAAGAAATAIYARHKGWATVIPPEAWAGASPPPWSSAPWPGCCPPSAPPACPPPRPCGPCDQPAGRPLNRGQAPPVHIHGPGTAPADGTTPPGSAPPGPDVGTGGPHDHPAPEEGTMSHSNRVLRRPRRVSPPAARTAAAITTAALALLGMQREPVSHRFRRLIECGRVNDLPVSRRLLPVHALARGA